MQTLYIVYAVLLLLGGVMGYARAKSAPSLIGGIVAAALSVAAALLLHHHPRAGMGLETLVSLGMGVLFLRRYQTTRKPMPALPVLVLSLIVLVATLLHYAQAASHPV